MLLIKLMQLCAPRARAGRRAAAEHRWYAAAVLLAAIGGGEPAAAQSTGTPPLELEDILSIRAFTDHTPIAMSPDGGMVAFTLAEPRRAADDGPVNAYFDGRGAPRSNRGADVWIADVRTGAARRLGDGHGSSWGPVWSPAGDWLAFYSDRDGIARIWVWDRARNAVGRVSDAAVRPFWGFEQMHWSPDGTSLLVKLMPEAMSPADLEALLPLIGTDTATASERAARVRIHAHAPAAGAAAGGGAAAASGSAATGTPPPVNLETTRSFLNVQLGDLAVVDVASGRARRVARRVRAIGYRFSPAGDRIAYTTRQPDGGNGMLVYDRYDLWVVDASDGGPRLLAPRTVQEFGLFFSWSPDGEHIAYGSSDTVHVVRAADGSAVRAFARNRVALQHDYRAPLWRDAGTLVLAARDTVWQLVVGTGELSAAATVEGRRIIGIVANADAQTATGSDLLLAVLDPRTQKRGFRSVNLQRGTSTVLYEDDVVAGSTYQLSTSRDGRTFAFVAGSAARPPDVWIADVANAAAHRLTDLHPTVSRLPLGSSRLVQWTDSTGRRLQGALLLPAGYEPGRRYPLVVDVYDGMRSGLLNRFGLEPGVLNMHMLASRGYAVLVPDAPLRMGRPMADFALTVLPGVEAVIAAGVADPDRIAVMGHSYGGYAALALGVQSELFRAVISSAGFSNLLTQYTAMRDDGSVVGIPWAERDQGRMGAHPWEQFERYRDNSPFFTMDRMRAPVLLLHGTADRTVSLRASQETYVALRRLDRTVTLVQYEGEDHSPARWSMENIRDYWQQILAWLELHLAPRTPL